MPKGSSLKKGNTQISVIDKSLLISSLNPNNLTFFNPLAFISWSILFLYNLFFKVNGVISPTIKIISFLFSFIISLIPSINSYCPFKGCIRDIIVITIDSSGILNSFFIDFALYIL